MDGRAYPNTSTVSEMVKDMESAIEHKGWFEIGPDDTRRLLDYLQRVRQFVNRACAKDACCSRSLEDEAYELYKELTP